MNGFAPSRAERETRTFLRVRRLRLAAGASREDAERALAECSGDEARAVEWLRRNMRCGENREEKP